MDKNLQPLKQKALTRRSFLKGLSIGVGALIALSGSLRLLGNPKRNQGSTASDNPQDDSIFSPRKDT